METGILWYTAMGILGAITYILIWREYDYAEMLRRVLLGGIAGYVYFFAHLEYNMPNSIAAFVAGYFAIDFLEGLTERVRHALGITHRRTRRRG